MLRFDLQSHSRQSDGALAPAEVVRCAAAAGVELLALSDHDSVDGVAEALAEGARAGVAVVPAVEISAIEGSHSDLHILGYLVDVADPRLRAALLDFRADRELRAQRMSDALVELGFALDPEPIEARKRAGKSVGRPHLAAAVVSHPANRERLQAEGRLDVSPFIEGYLIEGRPAFRDRTKPSVPEAIELIHTCGGVAVWAHPFWDLAQDAAVLATIERFVAAGLDGVEAFYVTHTREQTTLLAALCEREGLLSTGSSDFHGPEHKLFSRFLAFETYGHAPRLGPIAPGGG